MVHQVHFLRNIFASIPKKDSVAFREQIKALFKFTDIDIAINVKIIMNTFAHIKMYIFNLQQASYGLLIYKTFLKLKLHGNDEGFYPKLHLQQLHHKKYHPMN